MKPLKRQFAKILSMFFFYKNVDRSRRRAHSHQDSSRFVGEFWKVLHLPLVDFVRFHTPHEQTAWSNVTQLQQQLTWSDIAWKDHWQKGKEKIWLMASSLQGDNIFKAHLCSSLDRQTHGHYCSICKWSSATGNRGGNMADTPSAKETNQRTSRGQYGAFREKLCECIGWLRTTYLDIREQKWAFDTKTWYSFHRNLSSMKRVPDSHTLTSCLFAVTLQATRTTVHSQVQPTSLFLGSTSEWKCTFCLFKWNAEGTGEDHFMSSLLSKAKTLENVIFAGFLWGVCRHQQTWGQGPVSQGLTSGLMVTGAACYYNIRWIIRKLHNHIIRLSKV